MFLYEYCSSSCDETQIHWTQLLSRRNLWEKFHFQIDSVGYFYSFSYFALIFNELFAVFDFSRPRKIELERKYKSRQSRLCDSRLHFVPFSLHLSTFFSEITEEIKWSRACNVQFKVRNSRFVVSHARIINCKRRKMIVAKERRPNRNKKIDSYWGQANIAYVSFENNKRKNWGKNTDRSILFFSCTNGGRVQSAQK